MVPMTPFGRLGIVAALVALVIAMPIPAQACGCAPVVAVPGQQTRPVSFDREVAIFSATVVEPSLLKGTVTLLVEQVWKGNLTEQITMRTIGFDGQMSTCDWKFDLGETYLVFGLGDSIATMRAEKCTLTAHLKDAGEALDMLKAAGYAPRRPQIR